MSDGHGPQMGCTYVKCGNPSASVPCPFTKDAATKPQAGDDCTHEWRQLIRLDGLSFYCVRCLAIERRQNIA